MGRGPKRGQMLCTNFLLKTFMATCLCIWEQCTGRPALWLADISLQVLSGGGMTSVTHIPGPTSGPVLSAHGMQTGRSPEPLKAIW